jgi:hypothetical protein
LNIEYGDIFYANEMFWFRDFLNICVSNFGNNIYYTQFKNDEKVIKIIQEKKHGRK